jgi:hypothetical protein
MIWDAYTMSADNIKILGSDNVCEGADWIHLAYNTVQQWECVRISWPDKKLSEYQKGIRSELCGVPVQYDTDNLVNGRLHIIIIIGVL